MAFHSFLQRRFAPQKVVHLPSLRSRMTGKYLLLLCKKLFFVSAHTCPFRRLPPPPSPTSGDGFFNVNHLIIFAFSYIKNINSFFLSRSLPPNTEGSAEPSEAIGARLRTQVRIVIIFCSRLFLFFRFCSYKTAFSFPVYYFPCL